MTNLKKLEQKLTLLQVTNNKKWGTFTAFIPN